MPEPAAPTPREMEILKVLWEHGPCSVRDVYRYMAEDEDLAYNTVQTMLRIMEDKALVRHHVDGRAFVYKAVYTREASVRGFLDRVFDGAADELVLTLLRTERISHDELDKLQSMIQESAETKGVSLNPGLRGVGVMSASFLSPEEWLVRSSLAGGVLLLVGTVLMLLTPQPARRQRLGELALLCSLLVAGLCALPAWTPWSIPLWSEAPSERTEQLVLQSKPEDGQLLNVEDADLVWEYVNASDTPAGQADPASPTDAEEAVATSDPSSVWLHTLPWLVTAYAVMTGFLLVRCGLGFLGLRRMWAAAVAPPRHVDRMLANLTLGWRRVPRIGVSPRVPLPVSFGLWRPTILIPASFCDRARQDDLRQVLVHELTHLKRLDSWSCLLVALGQSLYFHLPWFWWLRKQVRLCQEYVADAAAASVTSSEDYAEYLVSLSGCAAPRLPVGAHVMGVKDKNSDLFRRVTMLLNASQSVENRPPRWWSVLTAGAFFAVAILVSGIGLRATAQAEEPKIEAEIVFHVVDDIDAADAEIVVVRPDPTDENKFILVSPEKANVKWVQDLRPFLGGKDGKHFVWTTDDKQSVWTTKEPTGKPFVWTTKEPTQGKWVFSAQADSKDPRRFSVVQGAGAGDKQVIVVGPDGKVEGKGVQVIEGKDGKKIIIIIDKSASVLEGKKSSDKKEPVRQIIEKKIELAKPKSDGPEKRKQPYEEAARKALEAAKEKAKGTDVIIEKQAIEDVIKSIEKHVSKEEAEQVKKALESYRKALESTDKLKQLGDVYKRVDVDQQKIAEAVRKAQATAAMKAKESAAAGAAKAQEAETKARDAEARVRARAAKALTEVAKGEGAKAGGVKLGVSLGTLSDDLVAQLDLPKGQGIVIQSVVPDSPAAKAGFQPHDVLVEFNGKPVASEPEAFVKAIADLKSGSKLDAVVLRKGKKTAIKGIVLADAGKGDPVKVDFKEAKPGQYELKFKGAKQPEKIEPEKLKGQLKELENLKLPKDLEKVELELKHLPKIELKELKDLKLPKEHLEKLQLELKELPKIEFEKLDLQLKKLEDLKLPKEQLEKLKQLPNLEIEKLKRGDLEGSIRVVNPKGEIKVIEVDDPTIKAGERLHFINDLKTTRVKTPVRVDAVKADGKRVHISMNHNDDKFTGKYGEDSLSITVTGTVKDSKATVEAIVVKDKDKEDKYGSLEKVPEQLRAKAKRLVELAEKGTVDIRIEE